MVTAIVLLNVQRTEIDQVAQKLAETHGVSEVYSVAGRYDLAAVIRTHTNEELADVVTHHMLQLKGIENTETLIAFRTYSRHDLEKMFAIGFQE
jgi:DNA-binding Lrp family transcriptional regulator